jgi:hypothetical protein
LIHVLVYVVCQKVKVGVLAKATESLDCIRPTAPKVPKRDRATMTGHRSAAAYGANSAP